MSAFQASKDISNPIDMDLQSGLTQEVHQELSASQVLNGKDQARHRAAAPDADLRDSVQIPKESSLDNVKVDVVMLGTALIEGLGRDYVERYWLATVTSTGAATVFPIHFDDYTKAFGVVELLPTFLNDLADTVDLLEELRRTWDSDARLLLPVFGEPIPLYPAPEPEA